MGAARPPGPPARLAYYDRYREVVDDVAAFRESLSAPLPSCFWTNTLRLAPQDLARRLGDELGAAPLPVPWYGGAFRWPAPSTGISPGSALPGPGRTVAFAQGLYALQEEAALLPAWLLAPRPGERLLDLCAAPGNKTAQLAVALGGTGVVVANDLHAARVSPLRRLQERLGLLNVVATVGNGVLFPDDPVRGPYDAVLVDAPCGCDGTVRKHPRVALGQGEERHRRNAGLQRALVRRAFALCRSGGRVAYATCSLAPEENEAVVSALLRDPIGPGAGLPSLPGSPMRPATPPASLRVSLRACEVPGLRVSPGLDSWGGETFHPDVPAKTLRLWPHHNDTGGFFVALFDVQRGAEEEAP